MSHQKANMIKELGWHFECAQLLMIKLNLAPLELFLSNKDMW